MSQAVATTVVSIVLTGSTLVSMILGITAILSGGVDAILEIGWSAFVATVKKIVAEREQKAAIAW
ncbi:MULTISPECIES: uberolysin/carnocyclin family circular bacteriocin [Geobacillus]|uniref:Bacteriocin AS-48 n=1 Tax=Geobacillus subterraneus TaxID=129338 RepID=A0A679FRB9_9BACL|nr:hypothetical protein B4113_3457 [Geobacillus sp. B4113_201601]BBW97165.1 hypothetical protein GsuE55_19980 [Geobacillus subterraneus]